MAWGNNKPKKPNPFSGKDTSQTRHGFISEKRVAKGLGARSVIGSGSKDGNKSDAIWDTGGTMNFRIESKATKNKSYSLKKEILDKIRKEALATNRVPVLTLSFVNEDGKAVDGGSDYAVIPMYLFKELVNGFEDSEESTK